MDLDDTITIATPEGLEVHLQLAGAGSRFIAGVTDVIIQTILTLILAAITGVLGGSVGLTAAVFTVGEFTTIILYPILFEVLARGRTPGKRLTHLRVLRSDGSPDDLQASAIRNLMRLIDGPLLAYLPTLVGIAVTRRRQRPGDMAAGTIVIRESPSRSPATAGRRRRGRRRGPAPAPVSSPALADRVPSWDASAITQDETAAVRRFLDRRDGLDPAARRALARRLAAGLRVKVTGAPADLPPERFLETLERIKRVK